jgi:hypothetical protein
MVDVHGHSAVKQDENQGQSRQVRGKAHHGSAIYQTCCWSNKYAQDYQEQHVWHASVFKQVVAQKANYDYGASKYQGKRHGIKQVDTQLLID